MPALTDHASRFARLDELLVRHAGLWQVRPFHTRGMCWAKTRPELCAALLALDREDLKRLEASEAALDDWLRPWLGDDGRALRELVRLDTLTSRSLSVPSRLETGVPGRKWRQVLAFASALPAEDLPLLEWCAGKGHLGRLLSLVDQRQVTSLEWDAALCGKGAAEARRRGAGVNFVCADALDPGSGRWLPQGGHAVALHACGDLHANLVRQWADSGCRRLTFSPCCYHLTRHAVFSPLSSRAAASPLMLEKADLNLPLREVVTGGRGAERRRRTEVHWRLAFDEWQRESRGVDAYLPLSSIPGRLLSGSFTDFCRWAAAARGLPPPDAVDERRWLDAGAARCDRVRRMELVGLRFRRPLELWLVLDRVLFLEERGARVRLGSFCAKPLTPRNIMVDAQRQPEGFAPP